MNFDFLSNLHHSLPILFQEYGAGIYAGLFLVIFCETGLVIFPFLPGDSLLFTVGVIASLSQINLTVLVILLMIAAILGDGLNYTIGHFFGKRLIGSKWIKHAYLKKAQDYFHRYGAISVVMARFVPLMRTFVPFVAGFSHMNTKRYMVYNCLGGVVWVIFFVGLGYFFPNIPFIHDWIKQ